MSVQDPTHRRQSTLGRRAFFGAGVATALSAASWRRAYGANGRLAIGLIGFGLIGRVHARSLKAQADVDVAGVAETYRPRLEAAAAFLDGKPAKYHDFRRLLDRKDLDGVVVATPDHWHALQTMMACAAGKHVYVEKPLTLFVREGRWMLDVARRTGRVVQVGTQQRSGPHYQRARALIRGGALGKIVSVQCSFFRNLAPGFGKPADCDPPPDLDWNLWLGPAPLRRYNPNRALYHFRWFWDYSGGQMTNLGQHSLDTVYDCIPLAGPKAVTSVGGRFFLDDNCEVPDTQDAILEYPGFTTVCQYRECAAGQSETGMGGLSFVGTKGTMPLGRDGFQVFPDRKENPTNVVARILGGHPVGGPQQVPDSPTPQFWTEPVKDTSGDWKQQYVLHMRNFLDCIRSGKQPLSDLQSSHRVATACHLANISLRTGRKIVWDAQREAILGDAEAARMLVRPYRAPWDAELKSLIS